MDNTWYVSDLDGTLLNKEERVSPFTARVINRLVEQGVRFTYATARSRHSAEIVTQGLNKRLPVIVYNGAFIRQGGGQVLVKQCLSPAQCGKAREIFERWGLSPLVYTMLGGTERVLWRRDRETPGVARYISNRQGDPRLLAASDDSMLYDGKIFYFTCIGEREALAPAWEEFQRAEGVRALLQEEIYRPGEYWLEVMAQGATKAHAAQLLRERLGCSRMVAFGDGLNDLPLFEAAQVKCAVANAVPELKESASQIIPSNQEDGVAKWLLAHTAPALALGERAGEFHLRLYQPGDLEGMIQLFYETVHSVNLRDYTEEEAAAWVASPESVDRNAWSASFSSHYTLIAEKDGVLLGFGDMDDTGYLDRLYVHKDFQGRGVASAIVQGLEGYAWGLGASSVSVHASRTARPFFENLGYKVQKAQRVLRRGVELENFAMERKLSL